MSYDWDFDGADADALAMLGSVSGSDYVGAAPVNPALLQAGMRAGLGAPHVNAALMQAGAKAINFTRKIAADRKLRHAALSGYLPTVSIPCSSSATIAAAGALSLSAAPGVPTRITKYNVEPAIASYFTLSSITAARMNMIAGGTGGVPATRFLPTAVQAPIDNPVLGPGSPVIVTGTNNDAAAHYYYSSFDGIDVTPAASRLT